MTTIKHHRPDFLTSSDHAWVSKIIETYRRLHGSTIRHADLAIQQAFVPKSAEKRKIRLIKFIENTVYNKDVKVCARDVRMALFLLIFSQSAQPSFDKRQELARRIAKDFGAEEDRILQFLLSDIECERIINADQLSSDINEICNQVNLAFAKTLLRKATAVRILIPENSRRVIRQAKLNGLICNADRQNGDLTLEISGPLSIFSKTAIYGRGIASLLSVLSWSERYALTAICNHDAGQFKVALESGDPIKPGNRPRSFDSKLEEKFAEAVTKKLTGWHLFREPQPIDTTEGIIFPDFLLQCSSDPKTLFFCEIVGFWTTEYLKKKLKQWSLVRDCRFVLCINEKLKATGEPLPESLPVYFFKGNINPLRAMEVAFKISNDSVHIN